MANVFHVIPECLDCVRTIPKGGGWVFISGMAPSIPLPNFCERLGIKRMDVYWAFNERMSIDPNAFLKKYPIESEYELKGKTTRVVDSPKTILNNIKEFSTDVFVPDTLNRQLTVVQISHWSSETICFYNGEVNPFSEEKIQEYLDANAYIPIKFGEEEGNPILKEVHQSIVDALMLDGLNYSQALKHVIDAGIVKNVNYPIHPYYYKMRDEYAAYFEDLR